MNADNPIEVLAAVLARVTMRVAAAGPDSGITGPDNMATAVVAELARNGWQLTRQAPE